MTRRSDNRAERFISPPEGITIYYEPKESKMMTDWHVAICNKLGKVLTNYIVKAESAEEAERKANAFLARSKDFSPERMRNYIPITGPVEFDGDVFEV